MLVAPARRRSIPLVAAVLAASVAAVTAAGSALVLPASAVAPRDGYRFDNVADSRDDSFTTDGFGCASINNGGDVAFAASRPAEDGFNTVEGIYRADAGSDALTTIAEDAERFDFIGTNPSLNDHGQVSFAAALDNDGEAIFRGSGGPLTAIARTLRTPFNFFGFDTSVNDEGRVAFKAELDEDRGFDEGLFSSTGNAVATHYRASTSRFDGDSSRPDINAAGDIAFPESVRFEPGVWLTRGAGFRTITAPDPDVSVGEPVLNDLGTVSFERSFTDAETDTFVTEIVTGTGGPLTTRLSTRGRFAFFGFRPAALNDGAEIAFHATLDDFTTAGVFVSRPGEGARRVIRTGDTLDGDTVQNLVVCEEALNNSGQVAFVASLADPDAPDGTRTAVFRATPRPDPPGGQLRGR